MTCIYIYTDIRSCTRDKSYVYYYYYYETADDDVVKKKNEKKGRTFKNIIRTWGVGGVVDT